MSKFNFAYLLRISMVAAMGGLLFGYDWVVIGGAKPFYERFFGITDSTLLQGWAMSSALVGCMVGAIIAGVVSDKYGRKKVLIISALLFTASALGTGLAWSFSTFILFRLLGGIGIGLASTISPLYISEVSPADVRGRFVSLNQLTIVIGILLAQIVNWQIAEPIPEVYTETQIISSWNGQMAWRWMFWAETIPAAAFLVFAFFIPESVRWLVKQGQIAKAKSILTRISGVEIAEKVLKSIKNSLVGTEGNINYALLFRPGTRKIVMLGVFLAVFQQWCGINVIFNYAEEIFTSAGFGLSDTLFNIVLTGSVNLVFTFIAIQTVDRWGRRNLMLLGSLGLSLLFLTLGSIYFFELSGILVLFLIVLAIACYGMTLAPITWVILSEIFPNRIRGTAMSIATLSLWVACFILTYTFPWLNKNFGAYGTFWLYSGICLVGFLYILRNLPETKGKSLEEIEVQLTGTKLE